ncbi:hypothetical protein Vadar_018302 [Vaccinium darrowii]|uniref:Uncharacterized protein n=1 Tax=Vaccinium darrowii TaxID=229202 RepID=A0ACB7ZD23_9ERIC|nr:hypothetical protein Vadar_018302 [Vaccinium darrowii]
MAVPFHTATSTSYLHSGSGVPPPSPRCFVGFKLQPPGSFRAAKPNSHVDFRTKAIGNNQSGTSGSKPTQGHTKMFLEETPIVSYRPAGPKGPLEFEDLWSGLQRERILFIGDYLDEDFCDELLSLILYLDSTNSDKPLLFIINCLGGEVNPSLTIYDTLLNLNSPIATRCLGTAANMAAFLLLAGDKGQRFASPHSSIVLQPLEWDAEGQPDDYSNEANEIIRIRDYLYDQLATRIGQPVEKIHKDFEFPRHFTAQQALEYGLIDRIVRPPPLNPDKSKRVPISLISYD